MNQPRPESSVPALATAEHFLACVDVMVDWSALEPLLAAASAATTRPLTLSTFKIALLKQWYGIAESETAFAVLDRLSFRSFVGFNDDGSAADAAIVQELHRGAPVHHPALDQLVGAVEAQLRELGYAVRGGQLREPSIAPCVDLGAPNLDAGAKLGADAIVVDADGNVEAVDVAPDVESGANVDAGPNVNAGSNVESGPNRDVGPNVEGGPNVEVGATSLFRPGELGRMVEAAAAKAHAHAEGRPPAAHLERQAHDLPAYDSLAAHPAASDRVDPDGLDADRPRADPDDPAGADLIRAVIEWPWGQTTEVSSHLCIGRDYSFSPLAHELMPYTHVSRKHAEIMVYGDGVWVRDLGSRNGTYVNDEEVPKGQAYLIDGDSIVRFGPLLAVSVKIA